jgi:hypothetical protein
LWLALHNHTPLRIIFPIKQVLYSSAHSGGELLVRINPGSNVRGDNKTSTAVPGMLNVNIPEPKMTDGKFQCPVCGKLFNSREDYDSHAMAHHQSETETPIEQSTEARTT